MVSAATTTAIELSGPAKTAATQRTRIVSKNQLAEHDTLDSLWVAYKGKVYDVTDFAPDHPGGDDLILRYAGKDMGDIMEDPVEHSHSDSAFDILEEHYIGRFPLTEAEEALVAPEEEGGIEFTGKDATILITDDFKPPETNIKRDFKKHAFLDLDKPLFMQMWRSNFTKEFYLMQVHSPRHLKGSARLFGPWYLEMFTKTPWYVVPIVWLPIAASKFLRSAQQLEQWGVSEAVTSAVASSAAAAAAGSSSPMDPLMRNMTAATTSFSSSSVTSAPLQALVESVKGSEFFDFATKYIPEDTFHIPSLTSFALVLPLFLTGIFIWTALEHIIHSSVFHIDGLLPEHPAFLTLHYLTHGIHHHMPMDSLRLVMPPLLFVTLSTPFVKLAHALFPSAIAHGIVSGSFTAYVCYDVLHWALHHSRAQGYVKWMKQWHMAHHFQDYEGKYGVTTRFWDHVFGTDGPVLIE